LSRFQKKLEIITRENNRRGTVKLKASEADALMQLEFYKKRCEEMQKEHKQALVKMMPGYAPQSDAAAAQSSADGQCDGEDAALYEAEIMRLGKVVVDGEHAMMAKKKEIAELRAQLAAAEAAATEGANTAARLEQQNDKMREELAVLKTNLQYAVTEYDKVAAQANALHQQLARAKLESKCCEEPGAALEENARLQKELLAFKAANQSISEMYAQKEQQLEKLVMDEKKNLKEFYEQQLMESQVQYQLNLRIEMDALKSQIRHERSYREKAEADRDVQRARVKVIPMAMLFILCAF
jgi:chromosome segregation ATPase